MTGVACHPDLRNIRLSGLRAGIYINPGSKFKIGPDINRFRVKPGMAGVAGIKKSIFYLLCIPILLFSLSTSVLAQSAA